MKAVGYFRLSSGEAENPELYGRLADFCGNHGYELVATFVDRHEKEIIGYRGLLNYLRQPERGMIVTVISSYKDLGKGAIEALRSYFEIECLGSSIICLDGTSDPAQAALGSWRHQQADDGPGERVRRAMQRKAIKGEVLGRAPYGYQVGANRRLEVMTDEAAVVRHIYRLYLRDGLGIRLIARRLNEEGVQTRRGGKWSMIGVRDILRNGVYRGTYSRFGIRVPANHQPIISQRDFRTAQEKLDANRTPGNQRRVAAFLLSGLVFCGTCGAKMTGISRRQRWLRRSDGVERSNVYRYYQCQSRTNQSVCNYHTHRAEELEDNVRMLLLSREGELRAVKGRTGDAKTMLAEAQALDKRLQAKIKRLDRRLDRCVQSAATGQTSYEKLRVLGANNAAQRLATLDALAELGRKVQGQETLAMRQVERKQALDQLSAHWDSLSVPQRQSLLRELVDRIIVGDEDIQVQLFT